ncbi:MAG: hypothetical protein EHM28_03800 [Spirochaetaceae bacterium]|nr:MAG: hypothetical protein EHM28_03800 [Spirochaetaceae bacterium]
MNFKRIVTFGLFPVTACIIAFISLYPKLPSLPIPWYLADKLYHLLAYMILSGLAMIFFQKLLNRPLISAAVAAIACITWGGIIELVQPVTGRHCDFLDFLVNTAGVIFICTLVLTINSARSRRHA